MGEVFLLDWFSAEHAKRAGSLRPFLMILNLCEAKAQCPIALTMASVTFLASPNSIIVLGLKNSSFSTPA